ncbi:MAG: ABC transporter permease [Hyphomonadaceae bacterium]
MDESLITSAVRFFPLWSKLAYLDVGLRFRRSALGVLWLVIPSLAFAFGAGYVWAQLFHQPMEEFIPFIALGFAAWGYISGAFVEGASTFTNAQGYIRQVAIPLSVFVYRTSATQTLYFLIAFSVGLITVFVFRPFHPIGYLLATGGLLLTVVFGFAVVSVSAYLGARFRDFAPAMQSLFQLLFVLTPVIYPARILEERGLGLVAQLNPFAALIEIVRTPLVTGEAASPVYYVTAAAMTLGMILLGVLLHRLWSKKVVYWL